MPVDRLTDTSGAQAVQPIMFDEGGKDMYGVVAISDWDEEIRDVTFIFLIPLWSLLLLVPVAESLVIVCLPVFIGFFKASHVCLVLSQSLSVLPEYFQLFVIAAADLLVLSHNSCQSLGNMEEFFSAWGAVSFESSTHGSGREL